MDPGNEAFHPFGSIPHPCRIKVKIEQRMLPTASDPAAGADFAFPVRQDLADIRRGHIKREVIGITNDPGCLEKRRAALQEEILHLEPGMERADLSLAGHRKITNRPRQRADIR